MLRWRSAQHPSRDSRPAAPPLASSRELRARAEANPRVADRAFVHDRYWMNRRGGRTRAGTCHAIVPRDGLDLFHLLGGHCNRVAGPFILAQKDSVGIAISGFPCLSPWTFSVQALSSRPASLPGFTRLEMIVLAVTVPLSRDVRSPVAPAMRRCSSMINCSIMRRICIYMFLSSGKRCERARADRPRKDARRCRSLGHPCESDQSG